MMKVSQYEEVEFTYGTREERDSHVQEMELQGWDCGSKVKRLKEGVSIWDGGNKDNHEWYAVFWKHHS